MHIRLLTLLLLCSCCYCGFSQSCSPAITYQCDVSAVEDLQGFSNANLAACLITGQAIKTVIPFNVFQTTGSGDTVYRMRIESISNLPCGLCWGSSSANNTFSKDETGCITINGTTNDTKGQYVLTVTLSFDTNNSGNFNQSNISLSTLAGTNGQLVLRLVGPDDDCLPVNFSAQGQTANGSCQ